MSSIPAEMQAAYATATGPPEAIRVGPLPTPAPGPTDVLVAVDATAVNAVDAMVRSGAFATPLPTPFVIGRDLVGTVVEAGPGVVGHAVGDRVWANSLGHAGRPGAAAQYGVAPGERVYPLPAGVDAVTAVAVVHPAATAHLALVVHGRLAAGETVLVGGAAGHVGRALTLMATRAGAHVIATATAGDLDACRALGAETALDYRDPALTDRLRAAAPAGLDVHVDTSGHHDLDQALELLAPRGRVIVLAGPGTRPELPVGALYTRGDAQVVGFAISHARVDELAGAAARINALLADGSLRPRAVRELPLSAAAEAHALVEGRRVRGERIVLRVAGAAASAVAQ